MVQLTLPKNSKITEGKTWPRPTGARNVTRVPHLSLEPGRRRQPAHRHLLRRPRRLRADGSRRADLDQEQDRPDADLPPLLPRGRVRLLRHEHRRHQHARLHQGHGRDQGHGQDLSAAAHAGGQGPRAGPDELLRAVRLDRAVAARPVRRRRRRNGSRATRTAPKLDGLYECILCACCSTVVPELLVELRPLSRPGRAAAGQPLDRSTAATRRPASGSTISKTRSGSIAATPS